MHVPFSDIPGVAALWYGEPQVTHHPLKHKVKKPRGMRPTIATRRRLIARLIKEGDTENAKALEALS